VRPTRLWRHAHPAASRPSAADAPPSKARAAQKIGGTETLDDPDSSGGFTAATAARRFGDDELLEEIGRGGMGVVHKARQLSVGRVVAVKLLPFSALTTVEFIKRFRAETPAAAALKYPNTVPVHEVGVHQGQYYLVMDFINGPPLSRLVAHMSRCPPSARRLT